MGAMRTGSEFHIIRSSERKTGNQSVKQQAS